MSRELLDRQYQLAHGPPINEIFKRFRGVFEVVGTVYMRPQATFTVPGQQLLERTLNNGGILQQVGAPE